MGMIQIIDDFARSGNGRHADSRLEPRGSGNFHDFHQGWTVALLHAFNMGGLPSDYFAMVEKSVPDEALDGGIDIAAIDPYVRKANRVVIKHPAGEVIAVIEIVSPGNKHSRMALLDFVRKSQDLLRRGIHLLVIDLFPPTPRDPQGIHPLIWDEFHDEPFELPADKPLTIAAYSAGLPRTAYVEPVAAGDDLPSAMPLFLTPETYVPAPLEITYQTTWSKIPEPVRELILGPS